VTGSLLRLIPWGVSLVLHAAVLLIPIRLVLPARARPEERRIDLVFDQPAQRAPGSGYRQPSRDTARLTVDAVPALSRSLSESIRPPATPLEDRLVDVSSTGAGLFPSARDVLADIPVQSAQAASAAFTAAAADTAVAPLPVSGAQIGWEGTARKLIRRRDPQFPRVLSRAGQEVECVAHITVSPGGTVTRVQIDQSSGYTEIDASIEAALRDYLFSRVEGQNAAATVSFRFRLEKRD